jgi:hypothetical protein
LAEWHPIMALVEDAPGFWRMVAQYERCYGTVRMLKRGSELGYRADAISQPGTEAKLLGYFTSLRAAATAIHRHELTRVGVEGAPNRPRHPSKPL